MSGKQVTFNQHEIPEFDTLCQYLTERIPNRTGGCYRRLYTPKGSEVKTLEDIVAGNEYVVSKDRYKVLTSEKEPIDYKEIGDRTRPPRVRGLKKIDYDRIYQPVYHAVNKHHRELSSKAKKRMAEIHGLRLKVHENGKGYKPCCKVTVDYKQRRDINQVLMEIDKHLDSAPIDRIYKVEGNGNFIEVTDPSDLEMDQHIVAVPKSHKSGLDRFERYNMDGKMNIKVNTAPIIGQPYLHNPFPEVHPYQGKGHNRSFSKYKPLPGIGTKSDGGSPYSNPPTNRTKQSRQPVKEVDYDKDEGGKFRARGSQNQKGAKQEDIRNEKSTPIPPGTELNKQPSKEQKQNAEATNQTNREEKMDENTGQK